VLYVPECKKIGIRRNGIDLRAALRPPVNH
jgi:hypothetical protein